MHRIHRPARLNPLAQAIAIAWLVGTPLLLQAQVAPTTLPTGPQVRAGQASISTQGAQMTVRNSPNAILDWQSFSIGAQAGVRFEQANAASRVLNRVTGHDPSAIFGQLSSNGQVWLLNPNGVLFGAGSRVDVAGLVASTLRLNDNDFLAGRYSLRFDGSTSVVSNQGSLRSAHGGQIVLVGERVDNSGEISAPGGQVTLAASRSVDLVDTGLPNLAVRVNVPAGEALNLGRLQANGGAVDVYGAIVNQQGFVQADTLATDAQGRITLQATQSLTLAEGSTTQAAGGTLRLDAGEQGLAVVQGTASTAAATGLGGDLLLQGQRILLGSTAVLDASGEAGGGLLRVGGDFQGKNPLVRHADMVTVLRGAQLRADAGSKGQGGTVIVWSDSATRFGGHASALGGSLGGDGGLVEVSAKGYLDYRGTADLRAANGLKGQLLLDPTNLTIQLNNPDINGDQGVGDDLQNPTLLFAAPGANSFITAGAVVAQLANANVTLQATNNINVATSLTSASTNSLTLQAGNNIDIPVGVTVELGGGLTLSANDPASGVATGSGRVAVNGIARSSGTLSITNNGGSGVHAFTGTVSAGGLTWLGDVALTSGVPLVTVGSNATIGGVISGTGLLQVFGSGTLTLTGTNTYSGGTNVGGGTLRLEGAAATVGTGQVSVVNGAAVDLTNGATLPNAFVVTNSSGASLLNSSGVGTFTGSVSLGANTFRLNGAGGSGLTLSGNLSGTGLLSVQGGTVALTAPNTNFSGTTQVIGGTLRVVGSGAGLNSSISVPFATSTLDVANGAVVTLASGSSNFGIIGSSAGTGTINGILNAGGTLGLTGTGSLQVNAALTGTSAISIDGAVTLAGTNTYTGSTNILPGATLQLASGAALADNGAVNISVGGTLRLLAGETIGSLAGNGTVDLGNSTLTTGVNNASTVFAGNFTGGTGAGLTKVSPGVFTLTGTSTVAAPVAVSGGTLRISGTTANAGQGTINLASGGTLDITNGASVTNPLQASGGIVSSSIGNGSLAAGALTLTDGAALVLSGAANSRLTVARSINNVAGGTPESVSISGGEVAFTQANTYTGGTVIASGAAVLDGAAVSLGTGTIGVSSGAVLNVNNGASVSSLVNLAGTGSIVNQAGLGTITGTVALSGASTFSGNGTSLRLLGPITGTGGSVVTTGSVNFGGINNSYGGNTTIASGTLTAGGGTALPDTTTVILAAGATLVLGNSEAIGGLSNAGTINLGAGANTLTLNNASAATVSGSIIGSGSLSKTGAGDLTVTSTGNLGYAGSTVINQGTLVLDRATTLPDLSLTGTGTLAGNGSLNVTGGLVVTGTSKVLGGTGTLLTGGSSSVDLNNITGGTLTSTRPWINSGTLNLTGDDSLALNGSAGASLTNAVGGTLVLNTTAATAVAPANGTATINNQGALLKNGSNSTSLGVAGQTSFSNSGTIDVAAGSLTVLGSFTQTGTIDVSSGASFLAAGLTNAFGGELRGSGSIGVVGTAASPLLNRGVIRPGGAGAVGTLTFLGGLDLDTGTVELDLAGAGAGSFDQINASGQTLVLGGTLRASLLGGYTPVNGDFLPVVLTAGGVQGVFATTNLPTGFAAGYGLAAGEATRLIFSAAGGTSIFTNAVGNLDWSTPGNWNSGRLPGANDDALISSGFAVTHASGTDTIATLTINAANSLQVSGGSLDVTGATLLSGDLLVSGTGAVRLGGAVTGAGTASVSGGTLTLSSAASFAGLNLSGGVLGGSGSLDVVGSFSRSGGAVIGSNFSSISLRQTSGPLVLGGALSAGSVTLNSSDPAAPLDLPDAITASAGDVALNAATVNIGGALSGQSVLIGGFNGVQFNAGGSATATAASGDAIRIISGAYFRNTAGPSVFSVGGSARWLVYSADPGQDITGGLVPAFKQYGVAINSQLAASGNALLYFQPQTLTASLQGPITKVYDTTTAVALAPANFVLGGAAAGDTVTLTPVSSGAFASAGVGTGITVQAGGLGFSAVDTATGVPVFGYQFAGTASGAVGSITPAPLVVSGYSASNKVYDGGLAAAVAGSGSIAALGNDIVTLAGTATGSFADKNVGTAKPVSLLGLSLAGPDAANYTLVAPAALVADITARPLTVSGLQGLTRVYDATTTATVGGTPVFNTLAGDVVSLAGTPVALFADKNVGIDKPLSVSGFSLAGADAANYSLVQPTGLVASITPATLVVSGLTAGPRVYNGSTAVALVGTAAVTPLAGDSVTLAGSASASMADKNAGTGKAVTVSGLSIAGADAANYSLLQPTGLTVNVSAAPISVGTVSTAAKVYDTTASASVSGNLGAVVAGDSVTLALTGSFNDANVGGIKPVSWSAALSGVDAANYQLTAASGSSSGDITPALLTYRANPATGVAGQPLPPLSGSVTGFLGSDTLTSSTTGTLLWSTAASSASGAGLYAINGGGLLATNYQFVQALANANALTLEQASTGNPATTQNTVVNTAALASVQIPVAMSSPTEGRVLDVTPAFSMGGSGGNVGFGVGGGSLTLTSGGQLVASAPSAAAVAAALLQQSTAQAASGLTFEALDWSRLPRDEVQTLLAARARFKQKIFERSVFRLQQDPNLADVRPCRTERELTTGTCVITEALKREIQAARAQAQGAAPAQREGQRRVVQAALPAIERKLALLIGVNTYKDKRVPELKGAVPDTRAVQQLLDGRLGYETTVLENPGREDIVRAFNRLALQAEPNDSVIVYYAGHGVLVDINGVDTGYWLPSDVDAEQPKSWLSNADIARLVAAVGAKQVMLVSDSCYSGQLVGKDRVQVSGGSNAGELLSRRAAVVMSSGGDEPVADEGKNGHSVFAWHFMRALEGIQSPSEWQVGNSLFERVRAAVVKDFPQTPQYGANRSAGHQGNTDYLFERRQLEQRAP
jgi:fibronectin-binding autotransporter adhesin